MGSADSIKYAFSEYSKADLRELSPEALGGVLRERVHHMIEVPLYPTLLRGKDKAIPNFGEQAQMVFDVWRERGLPEDTPDILWVKDYLAVAERIRAGEPPGVAAGRSAARPGRSRQAARRVWPAGPCTGPG